MTLRRGHVVLVCRVCLKMAQCGCPNAGPPYHPAESLCPDCAAEQMAKYLADTTPAEQGRARDAARGTFKPIKESEVLADAEEILRRARQ